MYAARTVLVVAAAVAASGVGCGDDRPNVPDARVPADAIPGAPAASFPPSIDLGTASCGVAQQQSFAVANSGTGDLTYTIASSNPAFAVVPSSGTILAGTTTTFTATATVPSSARAGAVVSATLTITSNLPGATTATVEVSAVATGAEIAVPGTLPFGEVVRGTSSTQTLTVRNTGNAPAAITLLAPSNQRFGVTWSGAPGPTDVLAGGSLDITATFSPSELAAATATADLHITGAVCGVTPPASIALTGTGVRDGTVLIQGGAEFGQVACGDPVGAGATRTLTIINNSNGQVSWRAAFGKGDSARYDVTPSVGSLAPDGTVAVTITRRLLTLPRVPGPVGGTLEVVTTIVGQAPVMRDIAVGQELVGPYLVGELGSVDFGYTVAGAPRNRTFAIRNEGNLPAVFTEVDLPRDIEAEAPAELGAGADGNLVVRYAPGVEFEPIDGTASFTDPGACSDPLLVAVAGGTGPYAAFPPSAVEATCPVLEPFTEVVVTNLGNTELVITGCSDTSDPPVVERFVSEFPLRIGPSEANGLLSFAYAPGRSGSRTATLTCDTNDVFERARTWTFTRTLHGADLELSSAALTFDCDDAARQIEVVVRNTGDRASGVFPIARDDSGDRLPLPLELVAEGSGELAPGETLRDSFVSHTGDGGGSGSVCGGSGREGEVIHTAHIDVERTFGKGQRYPICTVSPDDGLPVTLTE